MKQEELYRKLLKTNPESEAIKIVLIRTIIINESDVKSREQIYLDHFAPEAPDEELHGSLTSEQFEAACYRFRSIRTGAETKKTKKKGHPENLEMMISALVNTAGTKLSLPHVRQYYRKAVKPSFKISESEFCQKVTEMHRLRQEFLRIPVRT